MEDEAEWASFLVSIQKVRWWLKLAERLTSSTAWRWRLGPSRLAARSYAWRDFCSPVVADWSQRQLQREMAMLDCGRYAAITPEFLRLAGLKERLDP